MDWGTTETDSDGWLEIPTRLDAHDTLHLTRRETSEFTMYRGAAQVDLGKLHHGRCDFGDLILQEESVFARRQLIDETGAPVPGIWVRGRTTFTGQPKGVITAAGGMTSQTRWHFEHRVRSDPQGWIELREFAPIQGEFMFNVEGKEYATPGGLWIETNSRGPLRISRSSAIKARLGEGLEAAHCSVQLVHQGTQQVIKTQFRGGALGPIHGPAGVYDIKIGDDIGVVIKNVAAPAGGETTDPRLDPLDIGRSARWVHIEVVDHAGQPVPRALVRMIINGPDGAGGRSVYLTSQNGKALVLAPTAETLDDKTCVFVAVADGYIEQAVVAPECEVRIVLAPAVPITLRVEGLPKLPEQLQLRLTTTHKPKRGIATTGSGRALIDVPEIVVRPQTLGTRLLQVYLEPNRQAGIDRALGEALEKRLPSRPLQFEFEVTGKPVEPLVFELSDVQVADLRSRIEAARAIIEEHRDG